MWPAYTTTKQAVTTDDVNGIHLIYKARQPDSFDAMRSNDKVAIRQ